MLVGLVHHGLMGAMCAEAADSSWVSDVGPFFAGVVALLIALSTAFVGLYRRPKLSLHHSPMTTSAT